MFRIRNVEEGLARAYAQGHIPGACHTYIGQEAIAVGVCSNLRNDDVVFSTHRGHGHALAKGVPAREMMAELFGKATGVSRGRGGSMHLFAPEVGLMGTTGIVGPGILQATGAGYSFQLLKTDQVSVGFFGDGAVNNGAFHEGINMAAIWNLPVIYVCENNLYATEVPVRLLHKKHRSRRARSGLWHTRDPRRRQRRAGGARPPPPKRSPARGVAVVQRCSIARPTAPDRTPKGCATPVTAPRKRSTSGRPAIRLVGFASFWSPAVWFRRIRLDTVDQEITDVVADALEFAKTSPYPEPSSATAFIYSGS